MLAFRFATRAATAVTKQQSCHVALRPIPRLADLSSLQPHPSRTFSSKAEAARKKEKTAAADRRYHWIEPEAEALIAKAVSIPSAPEEGKRRSRPLPTFARRTTIIRSDPPPP